MATRSFTRFVEQELGKFPHFIVCAVLEWVLIGLLFLDGFVGFLANEFAKFFELRVPCLFCTRIDHVFLHKNADNFYYNNSICEGHKKDVSSLAYCHNHKKLSDIRKMCEVCLLSFATEKESDCNTYKSLVGILHKDLECFVEDDNRQVVSLPMGKGGGDFCCCSCCGEPLKVKSSNSRGKNGSTFSQAPAPAPSPRAAFASFRNEEKPIGLELPHIHYTELKLMSDSESEIVEDDEGLHGRNLDAHPFKEDVKSVKMPLLPETEDVHESSRTPLFGRGNKFFGIPLTDSANNSPRWAIRIPRKSQPERTELAAETYEADMLGPGDNDSILNCLKRQVRIDRKSLMELYMELDEERSASAVAANNAMAMITRLQAEKAAVQMEALQYQRMMEEQAEYDQEALQATNDLLAKREEEIKALETELEAYREKYGYLGEDSLKMSEDEISDEDYQESKSQSCLSSDEKSECSTPFSFIGKDNNKESFNNLDVTITPNALKITGGNSKEESTNNHGIALPFSQWKAHEEFKSQSCLSSDEKSECSTPSSFTGKENNKESFNNLDVTITPNALKIARDNSKEESTNNHGITLPFSQWSAQEEFKSQSCLFSDEKSGCSTPSSFTGKENNKESFNNLDETITPNALKITGDNSKEESINNHGIALPFSQSKAREEFKSQSCLSSDEKSECSTPFSFTGKENNKESFNNLDVTITPNELKIAGDNSKEESTNNHGIALPFSQSKAQEEDQNEPLKNFKGEKTYLLGRLKRGKKINIVSSDDGVSSLQSSSGSVNQVDEDTGISATNMKLSRRRLASISNLAGKGRNSELSQQLSHPNDTVRAFEADKKFSKQEGRKF